MTRLRGITGALAAALLAVLPVAASANDSRTPMPVIPPAVQGDQCVEETDYMRRYHGRILNVHRDRTMYDGIRTPRHSLDNCLQCHADPQSAAVSTPPSPSSQRQQDPAFCLNCHTYAGITTDCFQCHATRPSRIEPGYRHPLHSGMEEMLQSIRQSEEPVDAELLERVADYVQSALNGADEPVDDEDGAPESHSADAVEYDSNQNSDR